MLAAKKGEAVRGFKKGLFPFLLVIGVLALYLQVSHRDTPSDEEP